MNQAAGFLLTVRCVAHLYNINFIELSTANT